MAAVAVKQYYIHMVGSVVTANDSDGFVLDIETYEDDLQNMLKVSLSDTCVIKSAASPESLPHVGSGAVRIGPTPFPDRR